ncbi:hypothetical protein AAG570_014036 [Ranatra chinensis]|uniref:Probable proline--tRNA ligase, mitochondrial n=1 Tax=Ranatra chinensis TaxID=642074 RepID=A0ABD0XUZ3_9HEMI
MRLTQYFTSTLREAPADAEIISHILMVRAGMIKKLAAGIYSYLPMGLRTIKKIENIVRECMNDAGAVELLMPSVQPAEIWQESGRWQQYGKELLRIKDRHDRDFCYGPTHEEVITDIVRSVVKSYKQLPVNMYQIQTKFRDEVRPRFGLMRGREFIMKDAYSFDADDEGANVSYEKMRAAYCRIFERCGLSYKMVEADSGSIGGSYSHEFMVLAQTGEDAVISCDRCDYAANLEKAVALKPAKAPCIPSGDSDTCPKCGGIYEIARGIEVGHIFKLGTKYSEAMNARYLDKNGKQQTIVMGCYGIGVGRIAAACVEQNFDESGICWPVPIAPFEVAVVPLNSNEPDVVEMAENIYSDLIKAGIDAVIDDRNDRAGSKLADADLIGYPIRINVGKNNIKNSLVELVIRSSGEAELYTREDAINRAVELVSQAK